MEGSVGGLIPHDPWAELEGIRYRLEILPRHTGTLARDIEIRLAATRLDTLPQLAMTCPGPISATRIFPSPQ